MKLIVKALENDVQMTPKNNENSNTYNAYNFDLHKKNAQVTLVDA